MGRPRCRLSRQASGSNLHTTTTEFSSSIGARNGSTARRFVCGGNNGLDVPNGQHGVAIYVRDVCGGDLAQPNPGHERQPLRTRQSGDAFQNHNGTPIDGTPGPLHSLRHAFSQDEDSATRVLRTIVAMITTKADLPAIPPPSMDSAYLFFFDGGSRGNPGPGDSGLVLVRITREVSTPTMIWFASMAYGHPTTTNNKAEYAGLYHGLRYAVAHGCSPLCVIGDSSMIIGQMRDHRPPKEHILWRSYAQCQLEIRKLQVVGWCHHPRAYNKMADRAANIAMDSCRSQQREASTSHPNWEAIAEHLNQDLQYWLQEFGSRSQLSWMEHRSREARTRDFFRLSAGKPPLAAERRLPPSRNA